MAVQRADTEQLIINGFMQRNEGLLITDQKGHILAINNAITNKVDTKGLTNIKQLFDTYFLHQSLFGELSPELHEHHAWEGRVWSTSPNGTIPIWMKIQTIKLSELFYVFTFQLIQNHLMKRDKVSYLAYNDMLTQLPNRLSFEIKINQLLSQRQAKENMFALLFIDLDRFKIINDTFGHTYGDLLLQHAAARLKKCFPHKNTVFRWGGDEFICLLPFTKEQAVFQKAQEITAAFSDPFLLRKNEIYVTATIGISLYPHNGEDIETLITRADTAMYSAKKQGRNKYAISQAEDHASNFEKLKMENMLRKAISNNQLTLYYQPQVNLQTKQIIAAEALIRWKHPKYGIITPNEFIPIAEESGLILDIDDWVLRTACKQLKNWQDSGLNPVPVSVNLSAQQFMQAELPDKIKTTLQETQINPALLEIEITETMVMQDTVMSAAQIKKIRNMGVRIAIDDFGTGYSSFQYLKNFSVDSLKIDKIFVDDIEDNQNTKAITNSMITLGHDLDLKVIAEGVETSEQLESLQMQSCDIVQGYLFYKPMEAEKINGLLKIKTS